MKAKLSLWAGLLALGVLLVGGCGRDFAAPPQPGTVYGLVAFDASGVPGASGARLRLVECGLSALAVEDGNLRIDGVPDGDFTVRIDLDLVVAGEPTTYSFQRSQPVLVRGPAAENLGTVVLSPAGRIRGRVSLSDGGSPLGAVVFVPGGDRLAVVDALGGFTLTGVPAGDWTLTASLPGAYVADPPLVSVAPDAETVQDLELSPLPAGASAGVTGTVVLGNPGPERGVSVELVELFRSIHYRTSTDDSGRFRLAGLPAGLYELRASHPGYRPVGLPNLELRPGEELELAGTLVLPPEDSAAPQNPWDGDPSGNLDDDRDGVPDASDNCPVVPNPDQRDEDGDGIGEACEGAPYDPADPDGDLVPEGQDNCPQVPNPDQVNHDLDPLGDACDSDDDDDGFLDAQDVCPLLPDPAQDPALCDWPVTLVYSAQDPSSGVIRLRALRWTPQGPLEVGLGPAPGEPLYAELNRGEAWGAAEDETGRGIYFHHRATVGQPFRLCHLSLADGGRTTTVCAPGGATDAMYPAVCGAELVFDRFVGDRWQIQRLPLPFNAASMGQAQESGLEQAYVKSNALPIRPYSFRYGRCAEADGLLLFFYATDFWAYIDVSTSGYAEEGLNWTAWSTWFMDPPQLAAQSALFLSDSGCEFRRSSGPQTYQAVFECFSGGVGRLVMWNNGGVAELSLPYADVREPALWLSPDGTRGLLAYSAGDAGGFDLAVALLTAPRDGLEFRHPTRLTNAPGWEGSPVWVTGFQLSE